MSSSNGTSTPTTTDDILDLTPRPRGSIDSSGRRLGFEPCVQGATISQEREWLQIIRQMALDVNDTTMLNTSLCAIDFAFLYVREDRAKRQVHIQRSKARARQRETRNTTR